MNILNAPSGFYNIEKAYDVAKKLQENDEDWQYVVVDCGNGLGRIDIYEDGELVFAGFVEQN